jgi:hypothetical protein
MFHPKKDISMLFCIESLGSIALGIALKEKEI